MDPKPPSTVGISSPQGAFKHVRSVLIDGVEVRRTSAETLRIAAVKDDDTRTEEEIHRLLDVAEPEAAMNRALRLLARRERSRAELASRLAEDGYPTKVAAAVLDRLSGYGYLDDARFAEGIVCAKRASGWGRRRIANALADKGVDPRTSSAALDAHVPVEGEDDRAAALLGRIDLGTHAARAKALRRLVSRGFSYEAATAALRRMPDEVPVHDDDA